MSQNVLKLPHCVFCNKNSKWNREVACILVQKFRFSFSFRESTKLWDLFSGMTSFEFKTIQDVIEELAECQLELDCLNGDVQTAIENLQHEMTRRVMEIAILQSDTFDLDTELKLQEENIKDIQDKQSQDKIELLNAIDANRNLIIANQETIDILHLAPIGEFALSF